MDTDQQVVQESDLALVAATEKFLASSLPDRAAIRPALAQARKQWADARFRLLFPDTVTVLADVAQAQQLRQRISTAADRQQLVRALLDLAGLLIKFAH